MKLKQGDKILFIGDSVTDAERNPNDPDDLGKGYPLMVAAYLQAKYPKKYLIFRNRGVGGNTLKDLKVRWEEDCLEFNPDVVSILIGINDTWNRIGKEKMSEENEWEQFEADYRYLLKSLNQRTDARVILLEPFVLPYPKDRVAWREDLDARIQIVRKMAREYQTDFVPLDGLLNTEGIKNSPQYYTGADGVHPTVAGHGVIAGSLLKTFEKD